MCESKNKAIYSWEYYSTLMFKSLMSAKEIFVFLRSNGRKLPVINLCMRKTEVNNFFCIKI